MFAGGIADKLGNRYEAKWLVRQLVRVLYGERDWLRFEGITSAFDGFEFAIGNGPAVEWHQTKKTSPNGNWTIRALEREGVLSAFRDRLSASEADTCYFVSEDPAKDARILAQKAEVANVLEEFEGGLSQDQSRAFTDLSSAWGVDRTTAWQWLRRSFFQVESMSELESHLGVLAQYAFEDANDQSTFEALRDYMEQRFNAQVSTEDLRQDLREIPHFKFKDWTLDPTLKEKLRQETESYLATYSPFGAGGEVIDRKEAQQVFDTLMDPAAPKVALVTGVAGSGKSGVIRRLINILAEAKVPHLAFRADHHLTSQRPEDFGAAILGRHERPTITLKGIAPDQTTVLIVDQVDALSEVSGRNGVVRNALLQLLDGLYALRTVRVVLVCRNYDFDNDPRIKILRDSQHENRIDVPLLDWETEIAPVVAAKGFKPEHFTPAQRELLRLPLNLAVYLEVAEVSLSFTSRDDLFRALVQKKERMLRRDRNVPWSLMQVMEALAEWMSDRQRLEAPVNVLDPFPEAQDILSSEGLIVVSRQHVNFFHESFFDYANAQAFARSSKSLYEMLVSSEQHLFRRTQCRQILEVMRQHDMPRYLDTLSKVLLDKKVRYHVKLAIAQWLGTLSDPTSEERDIVLKLDLPDAPFPTLVEKAMLGSAGWFDLNVKNGWLQGLLNDPIEQRKNVAFWSTLNVASNRPSEVAKLMREWWGGDSERARVLFGWLGSFRRAHPNVDLEQLCIDIVRSKPPGMFSEESEHRREMILVTWVEENSGRGAPLLKAYFETWFEMHPDDHPFRHDNIKMIDLHSIKKLCEKLPADFLEAVTDAFIRSLHVIRKRKENGEWDSTFESLIYSGHLVGDDEFLHQYRTALRAIAEADPELAAQFLARLPTNLHTINLHLHLHTALGNPSAFKDHFLSLLVEEALFRAGWQSAEWKSFADAAATIYPFLTPDEKALVEDAIFKQAPEYRHALKISKKIREDGEDDGYYTRAHVIHLLNHSGYEQWCVLKTIGEENLTPQGHRRFEMLDRKFPNATLAKPRHNEAYSVGSPIKTEHAERMSDDHWLKAMQKHDRERDFPRGPDGGGPHELGQVLKKCAKEDLVRFVALLERIPETTPHTYVSNILWAVVEHEDATNDTARAAVLNAHGRTDRPFGEDIARIISRNPSLAGEDEIFAILMFYAEHGDAEEHPETEQQRIERETASIRDLLDYGQSLHIRGVNGARGEATEALEYVLWNVPDRTEEIRAFIDKRVDLEPLVSVRCALMGPLKPLYNHDRVYCGQLIERLVSAYSKSASSLPPPSACELTPLITRDGIELLPYLLYGAPAPARRLLDRLRKADSEMMQAVSAFHVLRSSFSVEEFCEEADALIEQGGQYRVMASEIAAHLISVAECQNRVCALLIRFFSDDDEDVRKRASSVFSHADPIETANADTLLSAYLESPAFDGEDFWFFEFLKKTDKPIANHLIAAAEKLLSEKVGKDSSQWAYRDFHHLHELIQAEYAASENDPDLRRRLLDVIDRSLEHGIHGTDSILNAHDRTT